MRNWLQTRRLSVSFILTTLQPIPDLLNVSSTSKCVDGFRENRNDGVGWPTKTEDTDIEIKKKINMSGIGESVVKMKRMH